ncbi:HNH endonuclease signature motif containing protein [uncultured Pelagimonas sp.]|uniref:HNH endonuclease n=1 Tax=uncultured Pelagimonas sp. TaxID=1618102 RepID=UPI0026021631|nr:HNH endonuclease signature motif containing protein [uncultured Pelagimonas sp.]
MSKQKLSTAQRQAIWTIHGERCYLCHQLCAFSDTEIDHVIPERLAGTDELPQTLEALGLDAAFNLLSYENFLPSHRSCNRRKSGHAFKASPIIQHEIERAIEKKTLVEELIEKTDKRRKKDKVFADALILIEAGEIDEKDIKLLHEAELSLREINAPYREPDRTDQPLMLTPQLQIIHQDQYRTIVQHPSGRVGHTAPAGKGSHWNWNCPNCGVTGWSGAMCIQCGMMSDD